MNLINLSLTEDKKAIYYKNDTEKAILLYFHGGAFIYGNKEDLPKTHIDFLLAKGYSILCFDYPLFPHKKIEDIFLDIFDSLDFLFKENFFDNKKIFLFGRSAGGYISLVLANKYDFNKKLRGIISFYGYGLLTKNWYEVESPHYKNYNLDEKVLDLKDENIYSADVRKKIPMYMYLRKKGTWIDFISTNKEEVLNNFSLLKANFDFPVFLSHSTKDMDVPFEEFLALKEKFKASTYISMQDEHDFDRVCSPFLLKDLLNNVLKFLEENL